jgi:hypothetical protein
MDSNIVRISKVDGNSIPSKSYEEAFNEIREYILGKSQYVSSEPLSQGQLNAIAVDEIISAWDEATGKEVMRKWNNVIDSFSKNFKFNV